MEVEDVLRWCFGRVVEGLCEWGCRSVSLCCVGGETDDDEL